MAGQEVGGVGGLGEAGSWSWGEEQMGKAVRRHLVVGNGGFPGGSGAKRCCLILSLEFEIKV